MVGTLRYAPEHVDWLAVEILLQHMDAWTFVEVGIVLNRYGLQDMGQDIFHHDPILSHFVKAVGGNADLLTLD
jgi:hypothetical protein